MILRVLKRAIAVLSFVVVVVVVVRPVDALAAEVIEEQNYVTVSYKGRFFRLYLPKALRGADSAIIHIAADTPAGSGSAGGTGAAARRGGKLPELPDYDKYTVKELLYLANGSFNAGQNTKALRILNIVIAREPENYRALTMKGSLFFLIGDKAEAARLWSTSLSIKPEQPEVRALLEKIQ